MKKLFLSTIVMLLTGVMGAQASKIVEDSLQSKVLGAARRYCVYLPTGYERSQASYPVLYLLHGFSDDHKAWPQKGGLQTVLDELIETGEARPMIVIMPEAGGPDTRRTWNGYYNMPGWSYETFFFTEFMPQIEQKYRIMADKGHRAISGLSMGGGGSVGYAQKHPELFASCYAFSAWLSAEPTDELKAKADSGDKTSMTQWSVAQNSSTAFLRNADDATKEKLRTVKWFVDCGDDDFLFDLNVEFHQLMRSARIHSELRIRNGQHNWEYWHTGLRTSLPFASRNFDK